MRVLPVRAGRGRARARRGAGLRGRLVCFGLYLAQTAFGLAHACRLLQAELARRHAAFHLGELIAFLEGAWPLCSDDYDVRRWADAFLAGLAAA